MLNLRKGKNRETQERKQKTLGVWTKQKYVNRVDLVKNFPTTSNEYPLEKIGIDAAENEPLKIWWYTL